MYKGKFDQKSKSGADVQELLRQRSASPSTPPASSTRRPNPQQGAQRPAPQGASRQGQAPRQSAPASRQSASAPRQSAPASRPAPQSQNVRRPAPVPQKQGPRLGSTIFYTLYFLFILVFFLATFVGLNWLNGFLGRYEASQPSVKAQQVFDQIFTNPNWADIYDAAGAQDTQYEGRDAFAAYMEEHIGGQPLNYLETSAGLSGGKKFVVRLGEEKLATFTLTDQNKQDDGAPTERLHLADWQLSAVDVVLNRNSTYRVVRMNGHRTFVNNVELGDDHTIMKAGTIAADYLPAGVEDVSMCTQEISGLFTKPNVTVFDDKGNAMEVTYDEETMTFTERTTANTISDDQATALRMAAETYCLWMIAASNDRATAAKYYDPAGEAYSFTSISKADLWMQSNNGHAINDYTVTNFTQYSDSIFSARVTLNMSVTRTDGTVKDFPYARSLFFRKTDTGKWLCYNATNEDVSQPVGKVRLTFTQDGSVLYSDFFSTSASTVQTPKISNIPEGKVFSGWARQLEQDGKTIIQIMFQPDENGLVTMADGATLEPMTLFAFFENEGEASAIQEVPAETEAPTETDAPADTADAQT